MRIGEGTMSIYIYPQRVTVLYRKSTILRTFRSLPWLCFLSIQRSTTTRASTEQLPATRFSSYQDSFITTTFMSFRMVFQTLPAFTQTKIVVKTSLCLVEVI